jgi:long-chain acyl-CoA synthetase
LTETCGIVSCTSFRPGALDSTCGPPVATVRCALVSCPDIKDAQGRPYLSTDLTDERGEPCFGRGEVVVQGTNVASRYFKQPEATAAAFLPVPGWRGGEGQGGVSFATGDIGCFRRDGSLAIVDRKKNLVKLAGGEYIALEFLEMTFGNCDCVDAVAGGVMVYADGTMNKAVALVQASKPALEQWARSTTPSSDKGPASGRGALPFAALLTLPAAEAFVLQQLNAEALAAGVPRMSLLGGVRLLGGMESPEEAWTPLNGCLTATNKVQRRVVQQAHAAALAELMKAQQMSP